MRGRIEYNEIDLTPLSKQFYPRRRDHSKEKSCDERERKKGM